MGIIHSSLFFVNFAVFGKILWLNIVKHPSVRRWMFCIVLVPIMLIYWSLLIVGGFHHLISFSLWLLAAHNAVLVTSFANAIMARPPEP